MTKTEMEVIVGRTNNGRFYFEIIDGDRLVARVVNFDTAELACAAADAQIEALAFTPDIAAALEAYAASTNLTELWQRYVLVEQFMNSETLNGRFDSSNAIRAEMNRISREVGGRIRDEAGAISPYSKANWAKAKAARETPATQTKAA